jgi:hypothetical protein
MPYIARAAAATLTITPPGAGGGKGPSKLFVYSVVGGGVVAAATTGMTITVADGSATTLSLRYFSTPVNTSVNHSALVDYIPGVLFDTASSVTTPGAVVFTLGQTGTAITSPSIEVIYDFV